MSHEVTIKASGRWFQIPWRELAEYRDLLVLLVRRDFVAKYKQTVLGPLWFVIQPLLTTVVFTIIFGKVANIPTDGLPPVLFYLCGLLAWGYFAQTFQTTSTTFVTNAQLFGKVYFPRLVVPLAATISNLIALVLNLAIFVGFLVYYKLFTAAGGGIQVRWELVYLPLLIAHTAALSLGVGLWMSTLTAKYRDFTHLSAFMIQLWMYATPIIYPLSNIPADWRWLVALNPMAAIVESFRFVFLGQGEVSFQLLAVSACTTVALLYSGLLVFQRTERTFIDTV